MRLHNVSAFFRLEGSREARKKGVMRFMAESNKVPEQRQMPLNDSWYRRRLQEQIIPEELQREPPCSKGATFRVS